MGLRVPTKVRGFTYFEAGEASGSGTDGDTWYDTTNDDIYVYDSNYGGWYRCFGGPNKGYREGSPWGSVDSSGEYFSFPFIGETTNQWIASPELCVESTGCNSTNYGFISGGHNSGLTVSYSTIRRFEFYNDSNMITSSDVRSVALGNGGACNSSTIGYFCGGITGGGTSTGTTHSVIDRITFPFDSGSVNSDNDLGTTYSGGVYGANSSSKGYINQGLRYPGDGNVYGNSYVKYWTFAADSAVSQYDSQQTGGGPYGMCAVNSSTTWYTIGGRVRGGNDLNRIVKYNFSFESTGILTGTTNAEGRYGGNVNSSIAGFRLGYTQNISPANFYTAVDMIWFAIDADSQISSQLRQEMDDSEGCDGTDFNQIFI